MSWFWKIPLVVLIAALVYVYLDPRPAKVIFVNSAFNLIGKLSGFPDENDPDRPAYLAKLMRENDLKHTLNELCQDINITLQSGTKTHGVFCTPKTSKYKKLPVLYLVPVGGWSMSQPREFSSYLINVPWHDIAVFSLDIRVAPHHYPDGNNDAYEGLLWIIENADKYNIDANKIIINGGSAGAHLSTTTALRARDEGLKNIIGQILLYPATDLTPSWKDRESAKKYGEGYFLSLANGILVKKSYVPDFQSLDKKEKGYASPLHAEDLSNLPPALIVVAEWDILHDEGVLYAEALKKAGNDVTLLEIVDLHGISIILPWLFPDASEAREKAMTVFCKKVLNN